MDKTEKKMEYIASSVKLLPFDCWGKILEFFSEFEDFQSIILTIKGLRKYITTIIPFCLKNIEFTAWRPQFLDERKTYGYCSRVGINTNQNSGEVTSIDEKVKKWFPSMKHFFFYRADLKSFFQIIQHVQQGKSFDSLERGFLSSAPMKRFHALETIGNGGIGFLEETIMVIDLEENPKLRKVDVEECLYNGTISLKIKKCPALTSVIFKAPNPTPFDHFRTSYRTNLEGDYPQLRKLILHGKFVVPNSTFESSLGFPQLEHFEIMTGKDDLILGEGGINRKSVEVVQKFPKLRALVMKDKQIGIDSRFVLRQLPSLEILTIEGENDEGGLRWENVNYNAMRKST